MGWREQLRNPKTAGRAMMNVGGMQRYDQSHGYFTPDMSMRGGAMYNKGGRVELGSGTKKETRKEKKKRKRKEESQQVSRETMREAIQDIRDTKGKVHSLRSSREDAAKRTGKIIDKQKWFHSEAELKKGFGEVRDKGWGGEHSQKKPEHNAAGGRVGLKKGGDDKWIQKVNRSIKARGTEGKCTPITKKGCTGRAKALAKTFKKMAKKRKS